MAITADRDLDTSLKVPGTADPLYQAIQDLKLAEVDVEFPFDVKLAYQCRWTRGYATRVVAEYRRYLYLTQVCELPIAPSDEIDQAWHMHLLQTHFYWNVMCAGVLGRPLHHTPTVSGAGGRNGDITRYCNTLHEYKRVFKESPPSDIWPSVAERFYAPQRARETSKDSGVSLSDTIPIVWAWLVFAVAAVIFWKLTHLCALVANCESFPALPLLLIMFGPILLSLFLRHIAVTATKPVDLDAQEVAYLRGGARLMANTALIRLVDLGLVTFVTNGKTGDEGKAECKLVLPARPAPVPLDTCEMAVLKELSQNRSRWTLEQLSEQISAAAAQVRRRLARVGLINAPGYVSLFDILMSVSTAIIPLVVAILIDIPDIPIAFMYIVLGLLSGPLWIPAFYLWALTGAERKTIRGTAALKAMRENLQAGGKYSISTGPTKFSEPSLAMQFALFGTKAVIKDKRFYGINYFSGGNTATSHSNDKAGCGDNLPKCG